MRASRFAKEAWSEWWECKGSRCVNFALDLSLSPTTLTRTRIPQRHSQGLRVALTYSDLLSNPFSNLPPLPLQLASLLIFLSLRMQSINRLIWGPTPQEKVRKWQSTLKSQSRSLDREIHQLDSSTNKVRAEIKKLAQKGDTKNAKVLAREVVRSQKQKQRLQTSKASLNSIHMQLGHQLGLSLPLYFDWSVE